MGRYKSFDKNECKDSLIKEEKSFQISNKFWKKSLQYNKKNFIENLLQ